MLPKPNFPHKNHTQAALHQIKNKTLTETLNSLHKRRIWPASELLPPESLPDQAIIAEDDGQLVPEPRRKHGPILGGEVQKLIVLSSDPHEGQVAGNGQAPRARRQGLELLPPGKGPPGEDKGRGEHGPGTASSIPRPDQPGPDEHLETEVEEEEVRCVWLLRVPPTMRVHGGLAGYIAGAGSGAPARGQIPLRRLRPPPTSVSRSALFEIDGLLLMQWSPPWTPCRLSAGESSHSDFCVWLLRISTMECFG